MDIKYTKQGKKTTTTTTTSTTNILFYIGINGLWSRCIS